MVFFFFHFIPLCLSGSQGLLSLFSLSSFHFIPPPFHVCMKKPKVSVPHLRNISLFSIDTHNQHQKHPHVLWKISRFAYGGAGFCLFFSILEIELRASYKSENVLPFSTSPVTLMVNVFKNSLLLWHLIKSSRMNHTGLLTSFRNQLNNWGGY